MNIDWLELLGYLASALILVSMLMESIIKLRLVNIIGAGLFSIYGFLIGAFPVALMNLAMVFINVYYIGKIYRAED